MIYDFGRSLSYKVRGAQVFFFFNLKIKLLIFFFGPGGPRPPPGLIPSFECHKTICHSIYSLSVMNS